MDKRSAPGYVLREGFVGTGRSGKVYFQLVMCDDGVLRAAWRHASRSGKPKGQYMTRLTALKAMGATGGKDWKKAMRFDARTIGADGRDATASSSGRGRVVAKRVNWSDLEEVNQVPGITVMVKSMVSKLNVAFELA